MDWRAAHTMLHEQAIYQHDGEQYQVERLDFENHKAFVRKVEPDYFTDAMTLRAGQRHRGGPTRRAAAARASRSGCGEVQVVEKVVGYKKIKFHTHENAGYGDVQPARDADAHDRVLAHRAGGGGRAPGACRAPAVIDALRGIAHALHTVASVGLDERPARSRARRSATRRSGRARRARAAGGPGFDPTIFLYDHMPGGVGLAARLFDEREELLRRARRLLERAAARTGAPPASARPRAPCPGGAPVEPHPRKRLGLELLSAAGRRTLQ